jgi:hypothetical protein
MSELRAVLVYQMGGELEVAIARTGAAAALRSVAKAALGDAEEEVAAFEGIDDALAELARADRDRLVRLLDLTVSDEHLAPDLRLVHGNDDDMTTGG